MPHLICYDITGDSLRTKLGKKILSKGLDRINKSVYLGTLADSSLTNLVLELEQLMKTRADPQDSLIIIPIGKQQVQAMTVLGHNELDKEDLSGEKSTLII